MPFLLSGDTDNYDFKERMIIYHAYDSYWCFS